MTDSCESSYSSFIRPTFPEVDLAQGQLPFSTLIEPSVTWIRSKPEIAVDLYGDRIAYLAACQERKSHAKVLSTYNGAILNWSHCILVDGAFQCARASDVEKWALSIGAFPSDHPWRKHSGVSTVGDKAFLDAAKWTTATEHLDGRVLLASPDEPSNWGLFLLLAVPAAVYFNSNRDKFDKFLCFAPPGNFRDLLRLVGITDDDLIPHDVFKTYRIDCLSMFRQTMRDLYVHDAERLVLRRLAEDVLRKSNREASRRLYLSRRERFLRYGPYRELVNEVELINALELRGFHTINLEFLPVESQIEALASAEIVVGLGGAGMFNTVFSPPGTSVVDIESTVKFLNAHSNLFASCGHRYSIILGDEDVTDVRLDHRRWTIKVTEVVDAVDQVCAMRQSKS